MHTAFNFDFLTRPWGAASFRESIEQTLAAHAPIGAPSTWVLSNHDVTRPVTRYGREDTAFAFLKKRFGVPTDPEIGTKRGRAAALLVAALPGSLYIYQGDELGLPEVEDLPLELIEDPMHSRAGGIDPGRDGCRVPLPWSGDRPPFGFSPDGTETWLPQPASWKTLTVEAQDADPSSMLNLYREALRLRRELPGLGDGPLEWIDGLGPDVLAFRRGASFACHVNTGEVSVPVPAGTTVLLSSAPLEGDALPGDSTAWLRIDDALVETEAAASGAQTQSEPTPHQEPSAPRG
jgi:alpha-glucosidase